jgi:hypothetical protein
MHHQFFCLLGALLLATRSQGLIIRHHPNSKQARNYRRVTARKARLTEKFSPQLPCEVFSPLCLMAAKYHNI